MKTETRNRDQFQFIFHMICADKNHSKFASLSAPLSFLVIIAYPSLRNSVGWFSIVQTWGLSKWCNGHRKKVEQILDAVFLHQALMHIYEIVVVHKKYFQCNWYVKFWPNTNNHEWSHKIVSVTHEASDHQLDHHWQWLAAMTPPPDFISSWWWCR